jgi:homoserine dehydrogenase
MRLRIASLGYGNVGRALAELLAEKHDTLQDEYGLTVVFTGAFTRSSGGWTAPEGVEAGGLLASGWPGGELPEGATPFRRDALAFAATCPAEVLVELTTLEPMTGQPATDHIRVALRAGRSVVTANKGPIAHAYRELKTLAAERAVALRFESTVMDGTPLFAMVQAALPATVVGGFRGVLNSTSNFVLSRMAAGDSLEMAVGEARRVGVAEANPSFDLDGWDASVKATVLANVLMGAELRPPDVRREGLGAEAMCEAQASLAAGHTLKQEVEAWREGGRVVARVRLEALPASSVFGALSGMETAITLHTDTMEDLTLVEGEGGPGQTAFGVLADLINIARGDAH